MYLLLDAERVDVAEGDVPGVEPVGVVAPHQEEERRQRGEDDEEEEAERSGRGREPHSPRLVGTPVASAQCRRATDTPQSLLEAAQLDTGVEAAGVKRKGSISDEGRRERTV